MKYTLAFFFSLLVALGHSQGVQVLKGSLPLRRVINMSDTSLQDWQPTVRNMHGEPSPTIELGAIKAHLAEMRRAHHASRAPQSPASQPVMPMLMDSFPGNPQQYNTPPDNTMAISNNGTIVSCVNTQLVVLDTTGNVYLTKGLSVFAFQLGGYSAISDPRVIYDPVADRFIVLFFSGSLSTTSEIIVAFSQTNDPTSSWNFYQLSGNLLHDTTWSDYPVVSLTNDDFFVTFNHLQDSFYFPNGFRYSVIWQIDKQSGYNGDSLNFNYWHNIAYDGKPIWNICTVQGGSTLTGPQAYFLSVRPSAETNDTVFLHTISNSYLSGTAQFSTQMLTTSTSYGVAPDAPQVDGKVLATNDARILSAIIENDKIQYVQNSVDPAYISAGVYLGTITHASGTPVATGQILGYDTIGLGYPSIAYVGNGTSDDRAIITCSYLPAHGYPGTGAFYIDNSGNASGLLRIKEGTSPVNALRLDSVERWGDYSGIQKMYSQPNTIWLSGSYTGGDSLFQTWIAELYNTDNAPAAIVNVPNRPRATLYPNPATDLFTVKFDLGEDTWCRFTMVDAQGKLVRLLLEDVIDAGPNQFSFNTAYLSTGTYFLNIASGGKDIVSKPVVIQR